MAGQDARRCRCRCLCFATDFCCRTCRFKGEYWQARKTGNWEGVPDIYEAQH